MTASKAPEAAAAVEALAHFLRHLGWSKALEKTAHPLGGARTGLAAPRWWVLFARDPEVPTLAVLAPLQGRLTPLRRLYTQFEDLGGEVRQLLTWWKENPVRPSFLLLTDGSQTILFDADTEESLASAEEKTELSESVLPHMAYRDVARGSWRDFPRRTADDLGKELGAWIGHWTATVGASLGREKTSALELAEAVLLARLAERVGFGAGKPRIEDWTWTWEGATRKSKGARPGDLKGERGERKKAPRMGTAAPQSGAAVRTLRRYWHVLDAAGFLPSRLSERQLVGMLEGLTPSDLPDRWLASESRLSWKRFRADTFASALADEELRHRSWATMVTGAPPPPGSLKEAEDPSLWLHAVWEIDLDQSGYAPVLHALDAVVEGLKEYNLSQRATAMRGDRAHLQLELFEAAPEDLTPTLHLSDPIGYALGHVLRVRTRSAERARMMRFVLAARALELQEAAAPLLPPLPDLRKTVPDPA